MIARRHLRAPAWLALVAVLALAVLPTVAQALARAGGLRGDADWPAVCTSAGLRRVAPAAPASDVPGEPGSPASAHDDCPWCRLASLALGAPPAPGAVPEFEHAVSVVPTRARPGPRPCEPWCSALPRAPPAGHLPR
jgi:hypothetical protein